MRNTISSINRIKRMFNKTYMAEQSAATHVTATTHEHRAPTDQSIQLLNEMQDAALANIVSRLSTSDNTLRAEAFVMRDPRSMTDFVAYKITLNGEDYEGKIEIDRSDGAPERALVDRFARIIAIQVFSSILWKIS